MCCIRAVNAANGRAIAQALRPILDAYLRVVYPAEFAPGMMFGPFIGAAHQRLRQPGEIMAAADIDEPDRLRNYANRFHHDSNPVWQTTAVNDQELTGFVERILRFTSDG